MPLQKQSLADRVCEGSSCPGQIVDVSVCVHIHICKYCIYNILVDIHPLRVTLDTPNMICFDPIFTVTCFILDIGAKHFHRFALRTANQLEPRKSALSRPTVELPEA